MSERRVVAVLGRGLVPADTPILRADDLGALRGDGIFETIRVWGGRPWLLAEHLARLARSAARLELAVPPEATLVDLVDQACSAWPRDAEGVLRLVCTRGPEDGGEVTAYATIAPVGEAILRARAEGVRVLTATLGVPATARPDAPWLLGGAKTVSYAVNMACLRWAAARGAHGVARLAGRRRAAHRATGAHRRAGRHDRQAPVRPRRRGRPARRRADDPASRAVHNGRRVAGLVGTRPRGGTRHRRRRAAGPRPDGRAAQAARVQLTTRR